MDAGELDPPAAQRRRAIAANLAEVRARIDAGCATAGRDPTTVRLVVVTKTHPVADVLHLAALGVADVGENRDQEAAPKVAAVRAAGVELRWHFVGQLQRNKCLSVASYADVVHSVDRVPLVQALAAAATRVRQRPLDVLIQVSLDGDASRGGAVPDETPAAAPSQRMAPRQTTVASQTVAQVAAAIGGSAMLRLAGVMAVAPLGWPPERAFDHLAAIGAQLRREHPSATEISAGMSHDLEPALAHGATLVRIGTAVLGNRATLR